MLIPWPNRLEDGSYEFDGQRYQLPIDDVEEQDAIHGVRWVAWTVGEREAHRVVMEHALHPCPATRSLSPWRSSIDSRGGPRGADHDGHERRASVCPFGSGAHPYLTLGTETVDSVILRAPGRTVLRSDERGIPVGAASVEGSDYDFRRPRTIGATKLDSAFTDLERDDDGLARVQLRDPRRGSELTLWVDESYPYLVLFTGDPLPDIDRRSLAVEP